MPCIEETLDALGWSCWFSTLDLKSGYWQVPLVKENKLKTAFSISGHGFWECNRMPFGLKNVGATFQRLMEECLGELQPFKCLVHLDDVMVHPNNFEDHLSNLEMVFLQLRHFCLKPKPSKCKFFRTRLQNLGHVVSAAGVETDPEKIQPLRDWPVPQNPSELSTFLGGTGYYRRFVEGYAKVTRPLQRLMGKWRKPQSSNKEQGKRNKNPAEVAPWVDLTVPAGLWQHHWQVGQSSSARLPRLHKTRCVTDWCQSGRPRCCTLSGAWRGGEASALCQSDLRQERE